MELTSTGIPIPIPIAVFAFGPGIAGSFNRLSRECKPCNSSLAAQNTASLRIEASIDTRDDCERRVDFDDGDESDGDGDGDSFGVDGVVSPFCISWSCRRIRGFKCRLVGGDKGNGGGSGFRRCISLYTHSIFEYDPTSLRWRW